MGEVMSRWSDERDGEGGRERAPPSHTGQQEREEPPDERERERTERERTANRRLESAEDLRAAQRLTRPTVPEQQMMSVLATLGERYHEDYFREHKVTEAGGWYVTHVDFAWLAKRLVVEVYGGPHYKPALDKTGTKQEDDARREATIVRAGWKVLVVRDTELTQAHWLSTVDKVRQFLDRS